MFISFAEGLAYQEDGSRVGINPNRLKGFAGEVEEVVPGEGVAS